MLRRFIVASSLVIVVAVIATPAFAFQCPNDMATIDAALSKNPQLSAANLAKVKRLRAEGGDLHYSGRTRAAHSAAVEKFAEAKRILGIR